MNLEINNPKLYHLEMNRIQVKRNVHLFLKEPTLTFDMLLLKNQNKKLSFTQLSQLALQPA